VNLDLAASTLTGDLVHQGGQRNSRERHDQHEPNE
jgi:hypothetical protein